MAFGEWSWKPPKHVRRAINRGEGKFKPKRGRPVKLGADTVEKLIRELGKEAAQRVHDAAVDTCMGAR